MNDVKERLNRSLGGESISYRENVHFFEYAVNFKTDQKN